MKRKFTMISSFIRTWIITFTCTCQLEVIYFVSFKGNDFNFNLFSIYFILPLGAKNMRFRGYFEV